MRINRPVFVSPLRLAVRTSPFHGENRGSIPLGDAIIFIKIFDTMSSQSGLPEKSSQTVGDGCKDVNLAGHTQNPYGCTCKTCRKPRYWLWILGFALFYIVSVVPVGLFLYTFKTQLGIDALKYGGFHTYKWCLIQAVRGETKKPYYHD